MTRRLKPDGSSDGSRHAGLPAAPSAPAWMRLAGVGVWARPAAEVVKGSPL